MKRPSRRVFLSTLAGAARFRFDFVRKLGCDYKPVHHRTLRSQRAVNPLYGHHIAVNYIKYAQQTLANARDRRPRLQAALRTPAVFALQAAAVARHARSGRGQPAALLSAPPLKDRRDRQRRRHCLCAHVVWCLRRISRQEAPRLSQHDTRRGDPIALLQQDEPVGHHRFSVSRGQFRVAQMPQHAYASAHARTARTRVSLSYSNDRLCVCLVVRAALEYIRRGQPDAGFPIFTTECLKWPGFVEFDDVNGKVLTYSAPDHVYKVREEPQPHAQRSRTPPSPPPSPSALPPLHTLTTLSPLLHHA